MPNTGQLNRVRELRLCFEIDIRRCGDLIGPINSCYRPPSILRECPADHFPPISAIVATLSPPSRHATTISSRMFSSIDLIASWRDTVDEIFGNVFSYPARLIATSILLMVPIAIQLLKKKSNIPVVNSPSWWQFRAQKKVEWIRRGKEILSEGRERFPRKPFKVLTELGEVVILPPQYAEIIKNDTRLNFRQAIVKVSTGIEQDLMSI